jgi:biopolymer transport protein ExbD
MAGSLRKDSGDDDLPENHEINVTPFIDVMLVLLIIFMVAAPLATVDINVDLPTAAAAPQPRPEQPLYVTLRDDLTVWIDNEQVSHLELRQALDQRTGEDAKTRIYLRADRAVPYGDLMNVMNLIRLGGYPQIALVGLEGTQP